MKIDQCRQQVVSLTLSGLNAVEVGEELGVHPNSVRSWLRRDPETKALLNEGREQLFQEGLDQARLAFDSAVHRLKAILDNPTSNDTAAVSAARVLIECVLKAQSFNSLEQELMELKATLGAE